MKQFKLIIGLKIQPGCTGLHRSARVTAVGLQHDNDLEAVLIRQHTCFTNHLLATK